MRVGSGPGRPSPSPAESRSDATAHPDPGRRWSIVLPVHNQADHLETVISSYLDALGRVGAFELLLVPNGCRDGSDSVCARLARSHPQVRVVACGTAGWGAAVRAGIAAARGDRVCYTNLARTGADDLLLVMDAAEQNPGSVVKARRRTRDNLRRRVGSLIYNAEARLLFGVRVRDINGTPKAFPGHFAPLRALRSDGDLVDLEFVVACREHGLPLREVAIGSTIRHGGRSTTGWGSAWRMYSGALALARDRPASDRGTSP